MRLMSAMACLALFGAAPLAAKAKMPYRPPTTPAPAVSISGVDVQMTAATLEEDCSGEGAPYGAKRERTKSDAAEDVGCAQTSMQLSIVSGKLAKPVSMTVTKVEFFDMDGKSLGELIPSAPTIWNTAKAQYEAWEPKIGASQNLSVSYPLSAPHWDKLPGRWGQTFVMKATISIGGKNDTVQHDVQTQTRLPPGVKT